MENNITGFTVTVAQSYAREGRIEEWIHNYLTTGTWSNLGLSVGLKKQARYWVGPLEIALSDISRCCGPEQNMEYHVDPMLWKIKTTELAASMVNPEELPPLIVQYTPSALSIRDGNHRYEALRLRGFVKCWCLIWYDSEQDRIKHKPTK